MHGGVGRYTYNLIKELRKAGLDVKVVCNEKGDGDYFGLAPSNDKNYEVVLNISIIILTRYCSCPIRTWIVWTFLGSIGPT